MQNRWNWVIVVLLTLGGGATAFFAFRADGAVAALAGSASGAGIGTVVSSRQKKEWDREREILSNRLRETQGQSEQLQAQVTVQNRITDLNARLNSLKAEAKNLETTRINLGTDIERRQTLLGTITGQLSHSQTQLDQVDQLLENLNQQRQDIENRIAVINQENPNLSHLEELQHKIEIFKVESRGLQGQIIAIQSEIERLESQKQALVKVEAQLASRQSTLEEVNDRLNEARTGLEEVSQQATDINRELSQTTAELELLRVTYDRLSREQQNFSEIITQLTPEISNLEAERQRILGAIEERQLEYERQAERLEVQQRSLQFIENDITTKQASLTQLNIESETTRNTNFTLDRQRQEINAQLERLSSEQGDLSELVTNLRAEVNSLEFQKLSLSHVQLELTTRQAELEQLTARVNELQTTAQELSHQQAELEFLRVTYDRLLTERENLEEQKNQLTPEISNLEAERQRILGAIEENQQEYHRIEELRQRLRTLQSEITAKESEQRHLERNIQHLQSIHASLEENNSQLQEENQSLQTEIRELREERENLESSIEKVLQPLREPLWSQLPNQRQSITNERQFLDTFISYIQSQGLFFPNRAIQAFHTSLKVQDISALVILAGISGTGKSELPQRYANYIGAQLLTLAVQPRWDSPQDLQGFYNYVEKKFKPTDLMRGLYQYNHDSNMNDRIAIVLLDEMNLARVEYYFSDFLSKLETRRSHPTYLEIDVGSLPVRDEIRRLKIPEQFLFVGTMNEDETTQSLSDKVLDRANVLTFGKPQTLQLRQGSQNSSAIPSSYLAYSDFQQWRKTPNLDSNLVLQITTLLNEANQVMESMGHPFAHRVYQAITQYVVNYPGVEDENSEAFKFAIADGFGQKLLPKLRGVMIDEAREELDNLERIINNIGDTPLNIAFSKARAGRYGQFQWQGLVYNENLS